MKIGQQAIKPTTTDDDDDDDDDEVFTSFQNEARKHHSACVI